MMPFVVFQGTTEDDGKFLTFETPPHRARFRVNMWAELPTGKRISNDYRTKKPCHFTDLMEQTVKPEVDKFINEAKQSGGVSRYGFSCYLWG